MAAGLAMGVGLCFALWSPAHAGAPNPADTWARVRGDILARYPDPPDASALAYGSIHGMLGTLDRWTRFYAPNEVIAATLEPSDVGIGAAAVPAACGLRVTGVAGAAATAGLRVDDCIVSIDGRGVAGAAEADRAAMLLGASRSASVLTVTRGPGSADAGGTALVAVRRDWRDGAPLENGETLLPDGSMTAITRVHSFPTGVTELLVAPKTPRMIVDLRGNPGGDMSEGVRFVDRFATEGTVLQSDVRGEGPKTWTATNDGNEITARLVVFVDEGTASAAEIVAAALHARRGAVVVGRPTVGKRSIQTVLRYEDGSAMQLTIGHFVVADGDLPIGLPIPTGLGPEDPAWFVAASRAFSG